MKMALTAKVPAGSRTIRKLRSLVVRGATMILPGETEAALRGRNHAEG
jgi:hypothetical protein